MIQARKREGEGEKRQNIFGLRRLQDPLSRVFQSRGTLIQSRLDFGRMCPPSLCALSKESKESEREKKKPTYELKMTGKGTPFAQGLSWPSTALRVGGNTTAPWEVAEGSWTTRRTTNPNRTIFLSTQRERIYYSIAKCNVSEYGIPYTEFQQ